MSQYTVQYRYTPELLHAFCRIHLWYHRRQHPLFLKAPGIFLVGCLIWRIFSLIRAGEGLSLDNGITLLFIGLFAFILVWMGFVHPYVFEQSFRKNLSDPSTGEITLRLLSDKIQAESPLFHGEYTYEQVSECYVTAGCIYLYANEQALLIPFESLKEEDSKTILPFLEKRLPGKIRVKAHLAR